MSRELLNTVRKVVAQAQKRGADGVRASLTRNRDSEVEWRETELERVRESTTMGLSITLFVDGRYSAHSTSDLRPKALEKFLDDTIAMTRYLAKDEHRKLPDPKYYENQFRGDLKLYDPRGSAAITGLDRRRAAEAMVAAAHAAPGGEKVISAKSSFQDDMTESVMATSNGMEGSQVTTSFSLFTDVSVRDEGDRKPRGYWYTVGTYRDQLESTEFVGREATRRALAGIGERALATGTYPCVIENNVTRRVLGGLLGPLSGNSIQQKRSFLAEKLGEQITSPTLTITDEPHLVGGFGSSAFDGEGMATKRMPIFERGVLRNYYLSTYYASKLEMAPTTGERTNLIFGLGTRDLDGLLAQMGTGLWITGFMGGNSNGATGDFSIGIRGHWVANGRPVHPVAEMNLGGNHLESWKQLAELGNDPFIYSSIRCPSLRFNELQFSGV